MGIPRKQKPSPAEGEFLFQLDPEPLEECVTAYSGIPLFVQTARSLDVPGRVKQYLKIKQRDRGLDEAGYVESFLVLNALGGDCIEDFERLREDEGLAEMLGHEVPSCEAARKFLYQFHDESKLEQAQKELPVGQVSYIAEESAPLRALAQVNQEMVQEVDVAARIRRSRPSIWIRPSSRAISGKRGRPIRASADISRCWRYGRR